MLRLLQVENLVLFERAVVEFGFGFQVVTGETGAGKSLLVDALSLLAGERAGPELLREGSDLLRVTGLFAIPDGLRELLRSEGLDGEEELVVRRELSREGRSRAFLNDAPVTLRSLQRWVRQLLRIHGQREELGLLVPEYQRELLDRVGGEEAVRLRRQVEGAYGKWRQLAEEAARVAGELGRREARERELREALEVIDSVAPEVGEEVRLREERERLRHLEALVRALGGAIEALTEGEGSAAERVRNAERKLGEIRAWEPDCLGWLEQLAGARAGLEEVSRLLENRLSELEVPPDRLDWIEERLSRLERLFRRFGPDTAAVVRFRRELEAELERLVGGELAGQKAAERAHVAREEYVQLARELSLRRRDWAQELSEKVQVELRELGLGHCRLQVLVREREDPSGELEWEGRRVACGPWGWDEVEMYWQPNPGEGVVPLARSASGGELSRISLALLLASGAEQSTYPKTLIFDEIDAGLGGAQGAALGRKLRRLSEQFQVLAVTHLPQVACFAHRHLCVSKRVEQHRTLAAVELLEGRRRQQEVARMLAAEAVTPLALEHAQELLDQAAQVG